MFDATVFWTAACACWIVGGLIAGGLQAGRSEWGARCFAATLLLGPPGWIIAALSPDKPEVIAARQMQVERAMTAMRTQVVPTEERLCSPVDPSDPTGRARFEHERAEFEKWRAGFAKPANG